MYINSIQPSIIGSIPQVGHTSATARPPAAAARSSDDIQEIQRLKERDAEVKRHEQAHKTTGGQFAGPIYYEYTIGPDGNRYAVGGHVNFNVSKESTPEQTIRKAQTIYRAALAPADPSASDIRLAMEARKMEQEARMEIQSQTADLNKQARLSPLDQLAFL
jgi:hypothetical protein